jgi:cell wall assembly regulator SMI1
LRPRTNFDATFAGIESPMSERPVLSWQFTTEPLSEKLVRSSEKALGVTFPVDYRACVRENAGGRPEPSGFAATLPDGRTIRSQVGLLLTLDPRDDENVLAARDFLAKTAALPDRVLPVIDDGEGRFVCLDFRSGPPTVAFWAKDVGLTPVAASFAEFLASLS